MNTSTLPPFHISLTADFYQADGTTRYDNIGLDTFSGHGHIVLSRFPEHRPEIASEQVQNAHAVLVLTPTVTAASLVNCENLLMISRFGVGYDAVDVEACTRNHVLVTNTPGAVDRPVAEATISWMLALTHRVLQKDRLVRTGNWDERSQYMGCELRDRTLGVIGLGGIGRHLVQLLAGFGMQPPIAFDPHVPPDVFRTLGVRQVTLEELLETADFVSLHCPLNEETKGLIGADQLNHMKPGAYLLNLARGGIVDEDALYEALTRGHLAGAALDCFAHEPVTSPHRLGQLDNVLLAPHAIAWTTELFRDIGRAACQSMVDVSYGRRPQGLVNPEVFEAAAFRSKLQRTRGASASHRSGEA